ncbi:MAG: ABC transporter permease [Acidimicrobiia bacterium]
MSVDTSLAPSPLAIVRELDGVDPTAPPDHRRRIDPVRLVVAVAVIGAFTALLAIVWSDPPAGWWDFGIAQWVDHVQHWLILNRSENFFFVHGFTPIAHFLDDLVHWALDVLDFLTWWGVLAVATVVALRVSGWSAAVTAAAGVFLIGLLGLWEPGMQTIAVLVVAVLLSLLIGVPLGVLSARRPAFERASKVVLDAMQVVPAYCYLLPMVLIFDIGYPPGVVATVVFALPVTIRLTSHALRGVPASALEVGAAFGADRRQTLRSVELPMARPALLLGVNQTVNLSLGIVVIAALVGAEGLGNEVLAGLNSLGSPDGAVGQAFAAGLAIVAIAIVFDRMTRGRGVQAARAYRRARTPERIRAELLAGAGGLLALVIVAKVAGAGSFPDSIHWAIARPINDAVDWAKTNLDFLESISNFVVTNVLTPMRDFLTDAPWWAVTGGVTAIGWVSGGRRVALACGLSAMVVAGLQTTGTDSPGIWYDTMDTFTQVVVAVVLTVLIGLPIGVLAGRSQRFFAFIGPLLDAFQVMPAFVYLVPAIALFNVGRFPGIVASVIYALPVGIRLTALGIRGVPATTVEAAEVMGATRGQVLLKVQLPQAWRSIMLGVNQTILMVMSMVVIAGLVGGGALGVDVVYGLTKGQLGLGVEAGIAIVALAVVLDRITQAWGGAGRATPRIGSTRGRDG